MAADTYSVPVIFKGGPLGGEVSAIPYSELRYGCRVPAYAPIKVGAYTEDAAFPHLPHPTFETETYSWKGERSGHSYVMRWESPAPDLRKTIEKLRQEIAELNKQARPRRGLMRFEHKHKRP